MKYKMASEIIFPQSEQPKSLENFLKRRFPIGYLRKLFRKNGVRLNGKRSGPKDMVEPGDRIQLYLPFEKRGEPSNLKIPSRSGLETLFENSDLLIINKRAGLAVHEGKEILKRYSLLGILEAVYRPQGIRPKLTHRIDKETSGLLVVAKSDSVAEEFEIYFEEGEIEKEYLALVKGQLRPKEGRITFPLPGRDGRLVPALTLYRIEKQFLEATLVRVKIKTGRMHQIRLHFAKLGHPVIMDQDHGNFSFNKQFRKAYGLKRHFLHAISIAFQYHGKKRKWTAPLPEDLKQTLSSLE